MTRAAVATAATALMVVAVWLVLITVPSPASAAACSGGSGVTVVVDFNSLANEALPPVQGECVVDGGDDKASELLPAAGFPLTYASRQPGFVCRVSGRPASDPCVNTSPANAYWGLWWSDGTDGRWSYSSLGVGSLRIPDGGYVAFSWDDVSGEARPSYTPTATHAAAPSPTQAAEPTQAAAPTQSPAPTQAPTQAPTPQPPRAPSASAQPAESTSDPSPSAGPTTSAPAAPSSTPTTVAPTPNESPTTTAPGEAETELADPVPTSQSTGATSEDGLPGWLAPLVIVLLFGIAGVVLLLKRRQPTP